MKIGFTLPQFGSAGAAAEAARFARDAEEAGAASLWVGDRLLTPVDPSIGYAGAPGYPDQFRSSLDPFVLLSAAAAATERVTLGTNVLNAPWYPPVLLARTAATLDLVAGGRLRLGLGTGWAPEEFAAVGQSMGDRGKRLDECLDVLDAWWAAPPGSPVAYTGDHVELAPSYVDGRLPQRFPVLLAGFAPRALDRVARRADGWLPVVVPGLFDPAAVAAGLEHLRAVAADAGRAPDAVGAVVRINPTPATTVAEIADTAVAVREEAGVDEVFVELMYHATDPREASRLVTDIVAALADR